jgi:hypothetical protein
MKPWLKFGFERRLGRSVLLLQLLLLNFHLSTWGAQQARAAACCGGGFSGATLITGDERANLRAALSATEIVVSHVDTRGIWRSWDDHQRLQSLQVSGARLVADRWQWGFNSQLMERTHLRERYVGLADTSVSVGYEAIPDWDYNLYRPRVFVYSQFTLPTGKSRFESNQGGLDSRGNGLWAMSIGGVALKGWGRWDGVAQIAIHRSLPRDLNDGPIQGKLEPGWGGSASFGGGYNQGDLRWGGLISFTYEDPIDIRGTQNIDGVLERYATGTLALTYQANSNWIGTISYADQTWFGSPLNTSLGRSLMLVAERRWDR